MASLIPIYDPSSITIETAEQKCQLTESVVNEIKNIDIPNMENSITDFREHMNSLINQKYNQIILKHKKGSVGQRDSLLSVADQTVFFIQS